MTRPTSDIVERLRACAGPWSDRDLPSDAAEEIAALKHDIERHISIAAEQANEIEQLRTTLGRERAAHCVCKCDDEGEFVSQCLAHKEVENERDALRQANDALVARIAALEKES